MGNSRCPRCLSYLAPQASRCTECGTRLRGRGGRLALWVLSFSALGLLVATLGRGFLPDLGEEPAAGPPNSASSQSSQDSRAGLEPEEDADSSDSGPPAPGRREPAPPPPTQEEAPRFPDVARLALEFEVLDAEGRVLRQSVGFPVFGADGMVVPLRHLNGAVAVVQRTSPGLRWEHFSGYHRDGAVLLMKLGEGRAELERRGQQVSQAPAPLAPGSVLCTWSGETGAPRTLRPVATLTAVDETGRLRVEGTGLRAEPFLFTPEGAFVGIGVGLEPDGSVQGLAVTALEAVLQPAHPLELEALEDLHFGQDSEALRERAALYLAGEHWAAAVGAELQALRLDPSLQGELSASISSTLALAAQEAMSRGQPRSVLELAEAAAELLYGNPAILHTLGGILLESGQVYEALDVLLSALFHAPPAGAEDLLGTLRVAYLRAGESHRAEGRLAEAAALLEEALSRYPDDLLLLKSLGYALYESGADGLALDALERVAELDAGQARALGPLLARLRSRAEPMRGTEIRFSPRSGGIRTQAMFNGRPVDVIVDTGATLCGIMENSASALGIDTRGARTIPVDTAAGRMQVAVVTLESVQLGDAVVRNLQAVILPANEQSSTEGFIGLNFLNHFEMSVDSERGILRLVPLR